MFVNVFVRVLFERLLLFFSLKNTLVKLLKLNFLQLPDVL